LRCGSNLLLTIRPPVALCLNKTTVFDDCQCTARCAALLHEIPDQFVEGTRRRNRFFRANKPSATSKEERRRDERGDVSKEVPSSGRARRRWQCCAVDVHSAKAPGRGVENRKCSPDLSGLNSTFAGWVSAGMKSALFRNWSASSSRRFCPSMGGIRLKFF